MKFLQEVLTDFRKLDTEQPTDELNIVDDDNEDDQSTGELDIVDDDNQEEPELEPEDDKELDAISSKATEDPDHQGLIRKVKGAHLVYKRESDHGLYDELWIYNIDVSQKQFDTKKAILAGTDIPTNKTSSPDGSQTYTIWSAGNAEMLLISGIPN